MASEKVGFGTNSLLEQWRDSYENDDYDYDPYDDDMYEGQEILDKIQTICDNLDIKMEYYKDEDDCFTNFESAFPAIVLDNTITVREALSWEPTVSPLNDNEIDFRISFDESDDED
ncbi:hypothetical protein Tco_0190327 [Tanacetum coccineum]